MAVAQLLAYLFLPCPVRPGFGHAIDEPPVITVKETLILLSSIAGALLTYELTHETMQLVEHCYRVAIHS